MGIRVENKTCAEMGMIMKILVMSDIHGNKEALQAVIDKAVCHRDIEACILLGDLIDYGMHSNEVIQMVRLLPYPLLCNLYGNHEDAVVRNEYSRFSSDRGRECARYTRTILSQESWEYIHCEMERHGRKEFTYRGKKCLGIHGSMEDVYWQSIHPEQQLPEYWNYDYVFSGHSHLPHFVEKYYACDDIRHRNTKKVIFINPGSVGQPRNLNHMAQFVLLDIDQEQVFFEKAEYDIDAAQAAYHGQVDKFYCERLRRGI